MSSFFRGLLFRYEYHASPPMSAMAKSNPVQAIVFPKLNTPVACGVKPSRGSSGASGSYGSSAGGCAGASCGSSTSSLALASWFCPSILRFIASGNGWEAEATEVINGNPNKRIKRKGGIIKNKIYSFILKKGNSPS